MQVIKAIVLYFALMVSMSSQANAERAISREKDVEKDQVASVESSSRKQRSEEILNGQSVPINEHLPAIESSKDVVVRSAEEVGYRALSLLVVALKGEGLDQIVVEKIVTDYGLEGHLTPNEAAFIKNVKPTQRERIEFSWRYDAAWTLLWALGYVDDLGKPDSACDAALAVRVMKERTSKDFLEQAKLREISEILDKADIIYRYHWAVVDGRLSGIKEVAGLDAGVVYERHYALNWLIGYMDKPWDEISTDT